MGDGSLCKGHNDSYRTCFTNKNIELINIVKGFFLNIGVSGRCIGIYPNTVNPKIKNLVIHSETISYFLNSFFKIPFGYKKDISMPDFMMDNKELAINIVRGIFDAEGCVVYKKTGNTTLRKVIIAMKDKAYLEKIKRILNSIRIFSNLYKDKGGVIFRLIIGERRSIIRFYRQIRPSHPEKNKRLESIVRSYKSKKWLVSSDLTPKILTLLLDGNKKRSEICDYLKISYSQVGLCLSKLQKKGLIKVNNKVLTNNGCWFVYGITGNGCGYLKEVVKDFS